ncbi:MAG: TM2 domain-containing protein [Nostoc sp. LPT]|uniref:TM2 domain-containing protein n=1 Tax=uncultured Nostoc sp. TaxID=340711 RepID=UPI001D6095F6|nr:TM2 domain-containing protein [Nostoc sp. LPT]
MTNTQQSIIHGLYEFDTVLSALWIRAGELTYELDEILNKPVYLETLKLKKLEVVTQSSTSSPTLELLTPTPRTTNSARVVTSHVASDDKKILAGIFAILLGTLGIHKFILGYTKEGVIMLLITLFTAGYNAFVMGIISIIEGIIYLTKSDREFVQTYVSSKKGWF